MRVLLVDDDARLRRGLRMRLELEPGVVIAGEAGSGPDALRLAASLKPDLVITDVALPKMDGIDCAARALAAGDCRGVIVHTFHDDRGTRDRARLAGAAAFVPKHEGVEALIRAMLLLAKSPVPEPSSAPYATERRTRRTGARRMSGGGASR